MVKYSFNFDTSNEGGIKCKYYADNFDEINVKS